MLAAFALLAGAIWLWRRQGPIKQVWLMVLLSVVMFINVAIWLIPDKDGAAPLLEQERQDRAAVAPE